MSKHIDFTQYVIHVEEDQGVIAITRAGTPQPCEGCGCPGEYKLHADWDGNGQCDVYECQSCLHSDMTDTDSPDRFELRGLIA